MSDDALRQDVGVILLRMEPGEQIDVQIEYRLADMKWHVYLKNRAGKHDFSKGFDDRAIAAEAARELLGVVREVGERLGRKMSPT